MGKKLILTLKHHQVFYIKTNEINYYITVPKNKIKTNICIEIKSKINNYNIELNDEVMVMENIKNTFDYIDDYNITLVLPILQESDISILEKIDDSKYNTIDKILGIVINNSYKVLKESDIDIDNQIILINNERYKTFINWFNTKYKNRVICKNLLDLIQLFNVNATSYKKLETPVMNFVVGSYNTEIDAPKIELKEKKQIISNKAIPQTSSGFSSYLLLVIITIIVASVVAIIAFTYK